MNIRQARKIFLQYIYTGRRPRYGKLINAQKKWGKYYTRRNNKMNKNNTGVYNYD